MVDDKRAAGAPGDDVISTLIRARDARARWMRDRDVVGQATMLFAASYETTANAMTWTLFLLAQHPQVAEDLAAELDAALRGGPAGLDALERLPLLDAVLRESMRIFPPVPYAIRLVRGDGRSLGALALRDRDRVIVSHYVTHHLPELYPDPERFDPSRWQGLRRGPYEYLPFGAGPAHLHRHQLRERGDEARAGRDRAALPTLGAARHARRPRGRRDACRRAARCRCVCMRPARSRRRPRRSRANVREMVRLPACVTADGNRRMSRPLAELDACEQAACVRRGELTPRELVDAAIARIERVDPAAQRVVVAALRGGARGGARPRCPDGPFRGVPFLMKDLGATQAGQPYCAGNRALRDAGYRAPHDTYLGARFRRAGLVTLGKTNTPEFGLQSTTQPLAFGPTRNPWDPRAQQRRLVGRLGRRGRGRARADRARQRRRRLDPHPGGLVRRGRAQAVARPRPDRADLRSGAASSASRSRARCATPRRCSTRCTATSRAISTACRRRRGPTRTSSAPIRARCASGC